MIKGVFLDEDTFVVTTTPEQTAKVINNSATKAGEEMVSVADNVQVIGFTLAEVAHIYGLCFALSDGDTTLRIFNGIDEDEEEIIKKENLAELLN